MKWWFKELYYELLTNHLHSFERIIFPYEANDTINNQQVFFLFTEAVMDNGMGQIVAARKSTGELISAILLLKHKGRAINLINTSNTFSKQTGAMHMLLDELICKILKDCVLFDFEGSTIPGVARFYQSFGARTETYFRYESKFIKQLSISFAFINN